jgi:hypothetical protein
MSPTPIARLLGGLLALVGVFAAGGCAESPVAQPIPFNHRLHVANEIECVHCHEGVLTAARAGLPRVEVCMECHEADITENPAAMAHVELVRRHARAGTEIPWQKLYALPAHVYYSHRRHVAIAGLECAGCHGDIAEAATPPPGPVARTLAMGTCMDCHEARGVENDCAWCHR